MLLQSKRIEADRERQAAERADKCDEKTREAIKRADASEQVARKAEQASNELARRVLVEEERAKASEQKLRQLEEATDAKVRSIFSRIERQWDLTLRKTMFAEWVHVWLQGCRSTFVEQLQAKDLEVQELRGRLARLADWGAWAGERKDTRRMSERVPCIFI